MRYSAALAWRSPPRLSRWRVVLPEDAWIGEAPHSIEKQASLRSRPGLSPAATSSAPALSWPTPNSATSWGAALAVRRSSSVVRELISADRAWWRAASVRSASMAAARGPGSEEHTAELQARGELVGGRLREKNKR